MNTNTDTTLGLSPSGGTGAWSSALATPVLPTLSAGTSSGEALPTHLEEIRGPPSNYSELLTPPLGSPVLSPSLQPLPFRAQRALGAAGPGMVRRSSPRSALTPALPTASAVLRGPLGSGALSPRRSRVHPQGRCPGSRNRHHRGPAFRTLAPAPHWVAHPEEAQSAWGKAPLPRGDEACTCREGALQRERVRAGAGARLPLLPQALWLSFGRAPTQPHCLLRSSLCWAPRPHRDPPSPGVGWGLFVY